MMSRMTQVRAEITKILGCMLLRTLEPSPEKIKNKKFYKSIEKLYECAIFYSHKESDSAAIYCGLWRILSWWRIIVRIRSTVVSQERCKNDDVSFIEAANILKWKRIPEFIYRTNKQTKRIVTIFPINTKKKTF